MQRYVISGRPIVEAPKMIKYSDGDYYLVTEVDAEIEKLKALTDEKCRCFLERAEKAEADFAASQDRVRDLEKPEVETYSDGEYVLVKKEVYEALELRIKELEAERNCLALTYDKQEQRIHLLKSEFKMLRDAANTHEMFGIYNKINTILEKVEFMKPELEMASREALTARNRELTEALEKALVASKNPILCHHIEIESVMSILIKALENIYDNLEINPSQFEIEDARNITRKALERGRGMMQKYDNIGGKILPFDGGDYCYAPYVDAEIEKLKERLMEFHTMSTVEMMCENESVRQHIVEWENRCLKAEADLVASQERVKWLTDAIKDYKKYGLEFCNRIEALELRNPTFRYQ